MKKLILTSLWLLPALLHADTAEDYFHRGAQKYVFGKKQEAKAEIVEGLQKFPNDERLQQVLVWFREEEMKQSKQKNGEQQKDEEQQKDSEQKQNGENQQEKDSANNDGKEENQDAQGAKDSGDQPKKPADSKNGDPQSAGSEQGKQDTGQKDPEGGEDGTKADRKLSGEMKTDGSPPVDDAEQLQAVEEANAAAKNEMTEAQARMLLDSMRSEEQRVRLQERNARKGAAVNLKDW